MHMTSINKTLTLLAFAVCVGLASGQNAPVAPAQSKQIVATVGGQPIYDDDLIPSIQPQLLTLRNQEYEIKRKALENLIQQKLLEKVAQQKGLTTEELLRKEVDEKVQEPTDAEVEAYYLPQKDRINRPLDEVRPQVRQALKQAKIQQLRQDYMKNLRKGVEVSVLLSAPKIHVDFDPQRVRGNAKAQVMIIEFSDYQCPFCHQVEPTLKDVLAKYGDKVSLAYRDFPLTIHPQAEIAAEASRCALEQGKFWEYHDQLFVASNLERPALIDYAKALKMDDKRFDSCLGDGKYKSEVQQDAREGALAGISGTPAFFINGVQLTGAQTPDTFIRTIEDELARARQAAR